MAGPPPGVLAASCLLLSVLPAGSACAPASVTDHSSPLLTPVLAWPQARQKLQREFSVAVGERDALGLQVGWGMQTGAAGQKVGTSVHPAAQLEPSMPANGVRPPLAHWPALSTPPRRPPPQLVRRNEELRLLAEKAKVQGSALARGQAAYRDRLNEVRALKLKVGTRDELKVQRTVHRRVGGRDERPCDGSRRTRQRACILRRPVPLLHSPRWPPSSASWPS